MLGQSGSGCSCVRGTLSPTGAVVVAGSLLGKEVVAVAFLRPLPGLGSEGNGSVKSRAGGDGPRVGLGGSGVKRKNMFPFPSLFFTSLFLPRIISANQGKSKFTKTPPFP